MKKYLNSIIIILLFILFSIFNAREYFLFHSENKKEVLNIEKTKEKVSNFSFDKIRKLESLEIYKTPDKNLLKTLVQKIGNARNRIYIEAYIFTEKEIRSALIKAKKRGIDIKVEMEKNVYMANNINKKTYDEFIKNKIDVIWSDSNNYALNHSKFFIIDDELLLSTGNFSYSMFTKNRDFMLFIKDKLILEKILANFVFDFKKDKNFIYDDNLVLSPFYSREKIEFLLKNAKKEILIYFPYFDDVGLQSILEDKLNEGLNIKIITDKKNTKVDEFKSIGFDVKVLDKYTEHGKIIIVDGTYAYLGSVNFSTSSLDKNKETGILFKNENVITKLKDFFFEDFK
ncbi:MAG: phospholipase D-like domain-containing protein [Candidatus Gracilibacteria bacterium]